MLELAELLENRLDRSADIGPQDEVERGRLLLPKPVEKVLERHVHRLAREAALAADAAALHGDLAGTGDRLDDVEPFAGHRRNIESAHEDRL